MDAPCAAFGPRADATMFEDAKQFAKMDPSGLLNSARSLNDKGVGVVATPIGVLPRDSH